jgi:hypothetical protein
MVTSDPRSSSCFLTQIPGKRLKGRLPQSCAGIVLVLILLPLAGCGGGSGEDLHKVTGSVTLDGKSLSDANVEFYPVAEGSSASAVTDENGDYELDFTADEKGAPVGKYTVSISKVEDTPQGDREVLPLIYNEETTLEAEVTSDGDNVFNFELKSK